MNREPQPLDDAAILALGRDTFDQEAAGRGQFARVRILFEPDRTARSVERDLSGWVL